eukprot:CAMPEP_0202883360 /NCGR_PEP_ID=MMETSP1391-20130828/39327_1 /ASSEMBLY_ACC=CAM_ASM_000867 /TAXON_ID=1034604 /ORGANISM="Chlamydomonas leiostraca, Strain SAG 11-49" /LENGTH=163 /DNA_ID=CAMNT_0049566361 /DNA_START=565 /DNA_END=1057 /DNA_ORIENTATION=+
MKTKQQQHSSITHAACTTTQVALRPSTGRAAGGGGGGGGGGPGGGGALEDNGACMGASPGARLSAGAPRGAAVMGVGGAGGGPGGAGGIVRRLCTVLLALPSTQILRRLLPLLPPPSWLSWCRLSAAKAASCCTVNSFYLVVAGWEDVQCQICGLEEPRLMVY